MTTQYQVAAVQMDSTVDKRANLKRAIALIAEAAAAGASLVALPEYFNCLGPHPRMVAEAEAVSGLTSVALAELARKKNIYILAGSICEQSGEAGRAYNTSLLFAPDGEIICQYRKIHLFDVDIRGQFTSQESRWIKPGNRIATVKTPLGILGISICYDLRFPELYRCLSDQQVQVIFVPSAFRQATGRSHWEVLLRARSIENQAYVVAPNQCGGLNPETINYGNSMILDAWGNVLTRADTTEGVIIAEIDLDNLQQIREQLPALKHRRDTNIF
jgi:predicted amidohydrolase